ncbi:hypothetical protein ADIS_3639 [Lunatimonas lonarensis]|uniref:Uncharacterized protein n=1 Tax=Lunatimonas lonarensis TaxID=1232681 RepID=R7ZP70_9BACT|nr:hypothetical protein ADIS_3639 [Lunatimonas lonarensis]
MSVGLSKLTIIGFGLGTSVITARYLGPENNGIIAALLVYPSIFMTIGSMGIRQSTTYFLGKGIFPEEKIKTTVTQIWLLTSLISLIACYYLMTQLSRSGERLDYVLLALLPIPFTLFNTYNQGIFLGKNEIKVFNRINWIPTVFIFLFTAILLIVFRFGIKGYMIALAIGPIPIFILLLFKNKFIDSFSLKIDWMILKKMIGLGTTYAIALLIINLNLKLDIILLDNLSDAYQTGIYAKGAGITQYLWQIPMLFSTIIFARSATSKNEREFSIKVTQLLRVSFAVVGIGVIFLLLFSEDIIKILYGGQFKDSVSVLKILLPGVLFFTIFKSMNQDLAGRGKPWVSMYAMIPALIINIAINLILIPKYGANGAAIASTTSYTTASILFLHNYSKQVEIPLSSILKYKRSDLDQIIKGKKI